MNWFKRKKNLETANPCEVSHMMDNALTIQGKAMVNQTELNIAYQAYSLLRWHDGISHDKALVEAAHIVTSLETELEIQKEYEEARH